MKTLSERLAYLLADNNVKSSNGILQDLRDLEELLSDGDHPDEKLEAVRKIFGIEVSY